MDAKHLRLSTALLFALLAGCTLPPLSEDEAPATPLPPPVSREVPPPAAPLPDTVLPPPPLPEPQPEWPPLSQTSTTLLGESRRHREAGNTPQAASTLERALRIDPRQPILWLELGELHLAEGDFVQAESMASRALDYAGPYWGVEQRARALLFEARRSLGQ